MTNLMTPKVVKNGADDTLEIHWPIGLKLVGAVLALGVLFIGWGLTTGLTTLFEMNRNLAVLTESFTSRKQNVTGRLNGHERRIERLEDSLLGKVGP